MSDHRVVRWNFQRGDGTNPRHCTFSSDPRLREAIHPALASAWSAGLRLAAWRRDLVQLVRQVTEVPCAERRPGAVAGNQARRQARKPAPGTRSARRRPSTPSTGFEDH